MERKSMRSLVVTGGSSGLGAEIIRAAEDHFLHIYNVDIVRPNNLSDLESSIFVECDLSDPRDIFETLPGIDCDVLINCAGVNHLSWFEELYWFDWDRVMNINARAPWLVAQALFPSIVRYNGTILNIVSNASHVPMRASLAYNASKAAAHMVTIQMARELTKKHSVTVFGISPAKIAGTKMSEYIEENVPVMRGWTPGQARAYQREGLVTGEEVDPKELAKFIVWLVSYKERHFHLSGCVIPYAL